MRIGVLGTGTVGRTIATKMIELGHEVRMGSRAVGNEAERAWSAGLGAAASEGTFVGITDSMGERIQRALPATSVVKVLNTMNADVMVDPGIVPGDHVAFVCGDDADAKARTVALLGEIGWPAQRVVDCGDITGPRATEGYLLIWLRMMAWAGGSHFNIAVQRS